MVQDALFLQFQSIMSVTVDRIGRKPVILIGLSGVAVSTLLFGLSRTFWWAVISRSMAGALSGNAAVVQSVVGEITDETNQALAFPLTGLSWSFGCIIGPMIGYVKMYRLIWAASGILTNFAVSLVQWHFRKSRKELPKNIWEYSNVPKLSLLTSMRRLLFLNHLLYRMRPNLHERGMSPQS